MAKRSQNATLLLLLEIFNPRGIKEAREASKAFFKKDVKKTVVGCCYKSRLPKDLLLCHEKAHWWIWLQTTAKTKYVQRVIFHHEAP